MRIIINPGTGPVEKATLENAEHAIRVFVEDLELEDVTIARDCTQDSKDGRYGFKLGYDNRSVDIAMPGCDPELTRLSKPWTSPRLYVDGSSWLWGYAVGQAHNKLTEG